MNSINLSIPKESQDNIRQSQHQKESQSAEVGESSTKPQLHFMVQKAGMENIDAKEIARKIYEASKDSDHYKKQLFKTERAKNKGRANAQKVENCKRNERLFR